MKKIIIGIHGLKNKPFEKLLSKWWKRSIKDGLKEISQRDIDFDFELVYWANFNYESPLDPAVRDKKNPQFLAFPYVPPQFVKDEKSVSEIRLKVLDQFELEMDKVFLKDNKLSGFDKIADLTVKYMFKDLDSYYNGRCFAFPDLVARDTIRNELAKSIKKHKHREIFLVAHSMGSIIAYDTLTQVVPEVKINTFVTVGSPLGIPVIMKKILSEQHQEVNRNVKVPTPENIKRAWYNLSDLEDKIAVNYNLADDYSENSKGVKPQDFVVHNNYTFDNNRNPHKIYGYLRTPELAEVLSRFLNEFSS
jgi:hypothetical protein